MRPSLKEKLTSIRKSSSLGATLSPVMPNYRAYHLNLTQAQFYVLAVLIRKHLYPYGVYQQIAEESMMWVTPTCATTQHILKRFTALGFLEQFPEDGRIVYQTTTAGRQRLTVEIKALESAISVARSHLIWYNNSQIVTAYPLQE
jgi:DNA-binding PadR family transcriptional regulator